MMKTLLLILVIVLLASVVGYLAIDRQEKTVAHERSKSFDSQFAK